MAKTIYEGLRVGKNGGERWSGTITERSDPKGGQSTSTGKFATAKNKPKGGSVIQTVSSSAKMK